MLLDEVKVTLSSHQTRGGSVGGGGGLRKWDGGDKDDDGGNSGNPVSTIRGKCKCHPLPASCCSTCTCEHLSECSNEFSSTPPFGGTVHQMPNTITDAGGNHCKIQLKTLDIFHQTQLSL